VPWITAVDFARAFQGQGFTMQTHPVMHSRKIVPASSFVSVFGITILLACGSQSILAQASRPPDVPLPADTVISTISIPAAFTEAVVRPKEAQVRSQALANGQSAPDFQLKDVDGRVVKLSDFHGKVVVLNFWAMWCAHCVHELPDFVELERKYKDRGLEVIGVTADDFARLLKGALPPDPALKAKLKSFASAKKMTYPILMDTAEVSERYPHSGLPVTYVIDRAGVLREAALGEWSLAQAEHVIVPLLNK
jgi:cytochrome c biogenesis protein CcmG, thiol:disulfide interchange protein DsbE